MTASGIAPALSRKSLIPGAMLAWRVVFDGGDCASGSADLVGSNVLPLAFVAVLLLTYRTFALSNVSYILIYGLADAAHGRRPLHLSKSADRILAGCMVRLSPQPFRPDCAFLLRLCHDAAAC